MILILAIPIAILRTLGASKNVKVVSWPFLKTKMAMLLIIVKEGGCMLSSEGSGMTMSMPITLLITGLLLVRLSVTSSEMYSKRNFHSYIFALGDGRLRHCGKRITTAGSSLYWLDKLGRHD
jgi:hypothetical protein